MRNIWKPLLVAFVCVVVTSPVYLPFHTGDRWVGAHFTDSMNSIALIRSLEHSIPPQNPNYSGEILTGYHYFIHWLIAVFHFLIPIDIFQLYFIFTPIILISTLVILIYYFLQKKNTRSFLCGLGAVSIIGSSNLYYLAQIFSSSAHIWPSVAWIDEYSTKLVNYQLLSSYVIIILICILIDRRTKPLVIGVLAGSLMGFKAYAWVLVLAGLGILAIKESYYRKILFFSIIISIPVYFLIRPVGSTFLLSPLWFIRTMYVSPDRFNNTLWELQRQTYLQHKNYLHVTINYLIGIIIYMFINFWPKIWGFRVKATSESISLLKIIAILGIAIPGLFLQAGTAWNSIQFSYYSVFSLSILLILWISSATGIKYHLFAVFAVIILLIPGVIYTNTAYSAPLLINIDQIQASKILASRPYGVILLDEPFRQNAYFSAVSGKPAYIGDVLIVRGFGGDPTEREYLTNQFFNNTMLNPNKFINDNHIDYIVARSGWIPPVKGTIIFSNTSTEVIEVNK